MDATTIWPELPADVLREISRRLGDAGDFAHFHAVCKAWRDSHEPTRKQWGLPWLLDLASRNMKMRCIFSKTTYHALPPFSVRQTHFVTSADGTAFWHLAAHPRPSLRDLITGAVTLLPPFPQEYRRWKGSPSGVVYNDGTVLLRRISRHGDITKLRAALLRPAAAAAAWTVDSREFRSRNPIDIQVYYYRGKMLITVNRAVVTPRNDDDEACIRDLPKDLADDYTRMQSYILESSRGELLCVSIYLSLDYPEDFGGKASVAGLVRAISVLVHELEEDDTAPGKMRWVRKQGSSLVDRVLFLGWPNSFAVNASQLSSDAVSGGCVYFLFRDVEAMPNQPCSIFRYNLVDNKAKFVRRLPEARDNEMFTWLFPQLYIAPSQEIIDRLEGRKWWKKKPNPRSIIHIEIPQPQCYSNYFKLSVRNLPQGVDSFQLRDFFSKHGKVSNAKVVSNRKNNMSKKIGLVTIAMVEERADALAALDGLVFNRCTLEARLVRRWKGRPVPPATSNQHSRGYLIYIILFLLLFILMVWWNLI